MSAKRTLEALTCGILLGGSGLVCADEENVPEMEFLEYLGMWEVSDEDWQLLEAEMKVVHEEGNDPLPEGEESVEKDDES